MTTNDKTVAVRIPTDLLKKIERFRTKLSKQTPGVTIRQSDAVRAMLEIAAAQEVCR